MRSLSASALGGLLLACGRPQGPRLEVEATFHDFGTLAPGEIGRNTFRAINAGRGDLVVRSVRSSCGCALPELSVRGADGSERRGILDRREEVLRVGVGETLEATLLLDPRRAAPGIPEITGNLFLETNEPERPFLRFEFHVRFDVPFNVLPPEVRVDSIGKSETVTSTLNVVPTLRRDARLSLPAELPPGVTAVLERDEKSPLPAWRLAVTLGPGLPEGIFATSLFLGTDYREGYRIEIPIRARVVGNVTVHPNGFELGILRRSGGKSPGESGKVVALRFTVPGRPLRLGTIRVEGEEADRLAASVREVEPGRTFEIRLEPREGIASPVFRGALVVPTDDPENSEIRIPYRGFVRD